MIILSLLEILKLVLSVFTVWFQPVTELPFGIDTYVVNGFEGVRAIAEFFPPLGYVIQAFAIYVLFLLSLKIFKMIPFVGKMFY